MDNFGLFVGNLHYLTTNDDLKELFSPYSPISVQVTYDKFSGRSKGFGFIYFDSRDQLNNALNQLDGVEFKGHKLAVKEALPRPDRDENSVLEMTESKSVLTPFSTFVELKVLWTMFFEDEESQSLREVDISTKFIEQRDSISNEVSQQKNDAHTQFTQIVNEYNKTMKLLKPYL